MNHKLKVYIEKQWCGMHVYLCETTCARCDYRHFVVNKHKRPLKADIMWFAVHEQPPGECKADNNKGEE